MENLCIILAFVLSVFGTGLMVHFLGVLLERMECAERSEEWQMQIYTSSEDTIGLGVKSPEDSR